MARRFTYMDTRNWKVADYSGKPLTYAADHLVKEKRNKPITDLDGYRTARILADRLGGVAMRA
jgi:hypothetical protein